VIEKFFTLSFKVRSSDEWGKVSDGAQEKLQDYVRDLKR